MNNRSAWIVSRLALVPCLLALLATGTPIAPQARAAEPPASPLMAGTDELARGFQQPPEAARTGVFWFWINGNITREGITADLEAMARVGIRTVLLFETSVSGVSLWGQ